MGAIQWIEQAMIWSKVPSSIKSVCINAAATALDCRPAFLDQGVSLVLKRTGIAEDERH